MGPERFLDVTAGDTALFHVYFAGGVGRFALTDKPV
jgi:hypothetical protein